MPFPGLCSLSPELVVKIFAYLAGEDLVKCTQLSHSFYDVIKECSSLQYQLELHANGMSDCLSASMDIHSKRQLLQEYRQKWLFLDPAQVTKSYITSNGEIRGFSEVTAHNFVDDNYSLLQGPSRFLGVIANRYSLRKLDVEIAAIKTYTPQDLVVVLLRRDGGPATADPSYCFCFVGMSNCSQHGLSIGDIHLQDNAPPGSTVDPSIPIRFEVCGDQFAVLLSWRSAEGSDWDLLKWNWSTGTCLGVAPGPEGLFRTFALPSYVRLTYQDLAFLNETIVASGALIADKDGRNAWAAVDILEIARDRPLQQVRLLLPEISEGYSASKITLKHQPPVGDSKFYPLRSPFRLSEGDSILLIELELTGDTVDDISIMVPVGRLLAYRSSDRKDPASRNIPWDTWGPQNSCVCSRKADSPWHVSGTRACRKLGDSLQFFDLSRASRSFVSSLGGDPIKHNRVYHDEARTFWRPGFCNQVISSLSCWSFEMQLDYNNDSLKLRGLTEDCIMLNDDATIRFIYF